MAENTKSVERAYAMLVIEKLSELIKLVLGIVFVVNMLVVMVSGRNS